LSLGVEAGLIFVLILIYGGLTLVARRRNIEGFRRRTMTRRIRVPVEHPAVAIDADPPKQAER
jgi:hypothetical protein